MGGQNQPFCSLPVWLTGPLLSTDEQPIALWAKDTASVGLKQLLARSAFCSHRAASWAGPRVLAQGLAATAFAGRGGGKMRASRAHPRPLWGSGQEHQWRPTYPGSARSQADIELTNHDIKFVLSLLLT